MANVAEKYRMVNIYILYRNIFYIFLWIMLVNKNGSHIWRKLIIVLIFLILHTLFLAGYIASVLSFLINITFPSISENLFISLSYLLLFSKTCSLSLPRSKHSNLQNRASANSIVVIRGRLISSRVSSSRDFTNTLESDQLRICRHSL